MGTLSGEDIKKLAKLLATTLSFDDLAIFVHASTGDRLFDVFVSKDQPKVPMIVQLLNSLEDLGSTATFLAYVYVNRPGRPDVRAAITALFPEAVAVPDKKIDLSAQKAGAPQAEAPTNALAPGLQRNVRPYLSKLDVRIWIDRLIADREARLPDRASGTGR